MSPLGFKARVDPSLVCFIACMQWIPDIHLWCDTCWPLGGQHGSQSRSLMHVAEVGCWDSIRRPPAQWAVVLSTQPPRPPLFDDVKSDIFKAKVPVQLNLYPRFIVIRQNLQGKEKAIHLTLIRNSAHEYLILMRWIKSELGNRKHNWKACLETEIPKQCAQRIHLIVWKIMFN